MMQASKEDFIKLEELESKLSLKKRRHAKRKEH